VRLRPSRRFLIGPRVRALTLVLAGCAAIVAGVLLVSVPAGLIVAGLFALALGLLAIEVRP